MKVCTDEYTRNERTIETDTFVIITSDGTQFRITETNDHSVIVIRIGSGASDMLPLTITPVIANKVILS